MNKTDPADTKGHAGAPGAQATDARLRATGRDWVRQLALLLAAGLQIAGSAAPRIAGWGVDVGERSRAVDTAIVPPGWAFAIWGVIFLWSIALGLYGLNPSAARSAAMRRAAWPMAIAWAANGLWALYVPFNGIDATSQAIIVTGLISALVALGGVAASRPLTVPETLFVQAPIGLLAGWLTAATAVGASSVLRRHGVDPTLPALLALLGGAAFIASIAAWRIGGWFYAASFLWALAAILSRARSDAQEAIAITAGAGIVLVLVGALASGRTFPRRS